MKKIVVDKVEGVAEVIDLLLNEPDSEIILVIPNGSGLARTVSNFHLLKREADAVGKMLAIESVDEAILAFAKESGIEASHPLWRGVRGAATGMSDIVPKSKKSGTAMQAGASAASAAAAVAGKKKKIIKEEEPEIEEDEEDNEDVSGAIIEEEEEVAIATVDDESDEDESERKTEQSAMKRFFSPMARSAARSESASDDYDDDDDDRGRGSGKWLVATVIVLAVLGCGAYVASAYFNRATISIAFRKTPWSYQGSLTADKSVSADALANNVLAAQVFTSNKNIAQTFKASSVQSVSLKAQGTITIYNNYSASPQELVATTRFLTPDGKIFRITKNVTVPGAVSKGGALTASSIDAPIAADQPGPDYNVGPVAKLTIPGFAGKPQAAGFWGVITASTTGGYTGQKAVPTSADIAAAEASTTALLQSGLQGGFSGSYPNNFKILDGATQIQVGKLNVNTSTDDQGNFTVFGQATLSAIGFDEAALKAALLEGAQQQDPSSTFKDVTLNYGNVHADFSKGQVSFSLAAQGDLEPAFSADMFAQDIAGKGVAEAKTMVAALPQLSSGEISLWPSWLWTIPSDVAKIHINVD